MVQVEECSALVVAIDRPVNDIQHNDRSLILYWVLFIVSDAIK
jgi:hypothetical protein